MSTDNQLQANRQTAQDSTGPRIPDGKARHSRRIQRTLRRALKELRESQARCAPIAPRQTNPFFPAPAGSDSYPHSILK
jgi:hypothetical protein